MLSLSDQICNQNACAAYEAETFSNSCELVIPYDQGKTVMLSRHDPSGKYSDCTGGFENIISQCYQTGSEMFGADPMGHWQLGDQWYRITMNDTTPIMADSETELVDETGQVLGDTLTGPTTFCQGYSRGGGEDCIDIPVGCRIAVPLYNVIPTLDCSE